MDCANFIGQVRDDYPGCHLFEGHMMQKLTPTSVGYDTCLDILEEIKSKSRDYSWLWEGCRGSSSLHVTFEQLRKGVDPEKPYFFGELSSGIKFVGDARDYPSALHFLHPDANSTLINAILLSIGESRGDFIDVGSNIGVVSASVARHIADRGSVFSFEPAPETFKLAAATIALNGLKNVHLTQAAVSDNSGHDVFYATPGNSAIASLVNHGCTFLNEWDEVKVPVVTLDSFLNNKSINIISIKIDIEGHELKAIKGASCLIKKHIPMIIYEFTPAAAHVHGWSQQDSIDELNNILKFDFEALIEESQNEWISFPLPESVQAQVNVFAKPRKASL